MTPLPRDVLAITKMPIRPPSRLAEDSAKLVLGGETHKLTVMLCDIRGFTALSERLNAQGLARFVNEYLAAMTDVVFAHGGTRQVRGRRHHGVLECAAR